MTPEQREAPTLPLFDPQHGRPTRTALWLALSVGAFGGWLGHRAFVPEQATINAEALAQEIAARENGDRRLMDSVTSQGLRIDSLAHDMRDMRRDVSAILRIVSERR